MRFEILGPLRIWAENDSEIVIRSKNERTVLGVLLMRSGQLVRVDQIVEAMWPSRPPASYVSNLQTYVSRLRDRLPGVAIEHVNGCYRLPITGQSLDLVDFRNESALGRAALEQGDPATAAPRLRHALGQWRGRPLGDLSVPSLEPEVAQLEAERLSVIEDRIEAEFRARAGSDQADEGVSPAQLVSDLRGLVSEYPLRERLWGHLMVALCRAGRRIEALASYQEARQTLVSELGIEPCPQLQRLHQAILRGEEPGTGQESPRPHLASRPVFPVCQLPPPVTGFEGRAEFIERTATLVAPTGDTVPVVVISGQPGVGKTSLAVLVAHKIRSAFPDGQLFANLGGTSGRAAAGSQSLPYGGHRSPATVLADLLGVLGVPASALPRDLAGLSAVYRSRIADRRVLVVIDDAIDPAQVRALTPGTPGSAVLVTSRSRLSGLTDATHLPLGPLTDAEAYSLLVRVVGPSRVASEDAQARRIAAACGNLPLALRIAGTRLVNRGLRLETLADRLDDERRRLPELAISDQQVRASLALSVGALSDRAREAFALLGVVGAASFPSWVVAALLGVADADDLVEELVESNLLELVPAEPANQAAGGPVGDDRYRLHDLLRVYAEELLLARSDRGIPARVRLLAVATSLADTATRRVPRVLTWSPLEEPPPATLVPAGAAKRAAADPMGWLASHHRLLATMVTTGYASGADRLAALLAERLAPYLWTAGHWIDLDRVRQCASFAASRTGEQRLHLRMEFIDGVLRLVRGELTVAAERFATSRAGFERLGDSHGVACVLSDQAVLLDYQHRALEAELAARSAVDLFRARGDEVAAILASPGLSSALRSMGQFPQALAVDQAAVAAARKAKAAPVVLARCLNALALSLLLDHDPAGAYRAADEAVEVLRDAGDRYVLLAALRNLALSAAGLSRRGEAVQLLERSLELAVDLGDRLWATGLERDIAVSWIGRGQALAAVETLHRCLRAFSRMRLRSGQTATLRALARGYEELGRATAARAARAGAARLADPADARTPALSSLVMRLADPA